MLRLLLYPGVIVHELMHFLMCILLGVKVKKISFGIKESYVQHNIASPLKIFFISIAPVFGNLIALFIILLSKNKFHNDKVLFFLAQWLVISIIYYSIPSNQDTKNVLTVMYSQINKYLKSNIFYKFIAILYFIFVYIPAQILMLIFNAFDRYEILRLILIFFIYFLAINF